ncbi:hypothetical protein HYPDE_40088 [Hyphomicrobium denitrificans 1NES1]|uniref:Uncharacterized protein n=1 Tax=Hyphomicrobium denitrificans 1NES1 TaxID=670307 RepID=N0BGW7_9HYPH|nr:hypothetical protein HYPDE_40088 [Hyphomicrobium denitrificans 1NES1]
MTGDPTQDPSKTHNIEPSAHFALDPRTPSRTLVRSRMTNYLFPLAGRGRGSAASGMLSTGAERL